MRRLLSLAIVGLTASTFTLATPAESQAHNPFGISVNFGNGGFSYTQGAPYYHWNHGIRYGPGYYGSGYFNSGYFNSGYYDSCSPYYSGRAGFGYPEPFWGNGVRYIYVPSLGRYVPR